MELSAGQVLSPMVDPLSPSPTPFLHALPSPPPSLHPRSYDQSAAEGHWLKPMGCIMAVVRWRVREGGFESPQGA